MSDIVYIYRINDSKIKYLVKGGERSVIGYLKKPVTRLVPSLKKDMTHNKKLENSDPVIVFWDVLGHNSFRSSK